ncbi:MAG TPA: ATP-binding protein [Acidimicrobiia bacterium]|nr:ATP-binding protein [Acidimicrobiia bacterium]
MGRRLLVSTLAITVLALTGLGVPLAFLLDRAVHGAARARLERQAGAIALAVQDGVQNGRLPEAAELARLAPGGDWVVVRRDARTVQAGSRPKGRTLNVTAQIGDGASVRLATPLRPFDDRVRRSLLVLLAVAGVGLAGSAGLAVVQARRFARPQEALARAADRLGAGDFSASVPRCGLPEIDVVAVALEAGGQRVAVMVNAERRFSAHASHQLRSALTGLSLSLEDLAAEADATTRDSAASALEQVGRLSETVEELLALSRTGRAGERRRFDATRLVSQHVEDWRPRFARQRRAFTFTATGRLPVRAAPGALGQAVDVLLSNALKHGDGRTTVVLRRVDGRAELTVRDSGPGVALRVRRQLFDPAAATADGHGIGLSLARLLIGAEGGTLDLVDPQTATFRIRLPAEPDPSAGANGGPPP